MAILTYAQLEGLWIAAGGDPAAASTMAAIAYPESSANTASIQQGQPYATTGWGLWQITPGNSVPSAGIDNALLNPLNNAKAAVAKYNAAKKSGNGFRPWTTYTSGKYLRYVQNGVAPTTAGVLDIAGNVLANISSAPTTAGGTGSVTPAVNATTAGFDSSTCAIGINFPLGGGFCALTKVEVRALAGGILLLTGAGMATIAVVLLVGSFPTLPSAKDATPGPVGTMLKPAPAPAESPVAAPAVTAAPTVPAAPREHRSVVPGTKGVQRGRNAVAKKKASKMSTKVVAKAALTTAV